MQTNKYSQDQVDKKIKNEASKRDLNRAVDRIRGTLPDEWHVILTYLEDQATLKKVDIKEDDDNYLARQYCITSTIAKLYKSLSQPELEE